MDDSGVELAWMTAVRACAEVCWRVDVELQRAHGISLTGYLVLSRIRPATVNLVELADLTGLSASGVTRVTRRLTAVGLINHRRGDGDQRPLYVEVTAAGRVRLAAANRLCHQLLDELIGAHTRPGELEAVTEMFGRVLAARPKLSGAPSPRDTLDSS